MNFKKLITIFFCIQILFLSCKNDNTIDKEIHIDFLLKDESGYYNFTRMVFLPDYKKILFLFYNPDANFSKTITENTNFIAQNIPEQTVKEKIENFVIITNKPSDFYITIDKKNFIRFIDYIEGIYIFLPERIILQNSDYIYLPGEKIFYGDKVFDYISTIENYERGNYFIVSQNKHFRFETILLNLIYQLKFKKHIINKQNQFQYVINFFQTNMDQNELNNFFISLIQYDFFLLELPLISVKNNIKNETELFLNIEKSQQIYNSIIQLIKTYPQKEITLEILNTTKVNRLANRVKTLIDSQYYKVLGTDNFPMELEKSILICYNGNTIDLKKLINLLNISEKNIYFLRKIKEVGFSYLLGKDFDVKKLLKR